MSEHRRERHRTARAGDCAECGSRAAGPWRVRCEIDFGFGPQAQLEFCCPDHLETYFSSGRHRGGRQRRDRERTRSEWTRSWFTISKPIEPASASLPVEPRRRRGSV